MKKKISLLALMAFTSAVTLVAGNAYRNDTLRVTTNPQMHCANCENKIKQHVRFVKGVKKIETSVPDQCVTIVYDPAKAKAEDFTAAFRKIGYEIAPKKKK